MPVNWVVTEVQVIDDYALRVRFIDGLQGVVRFLPNFFRGVFSHLVDPALFRQVAVAEGTVSWPGHLDLAPDAMYYGIQKQNGEWIVKE